MASSTAVPADQVLGPQPDAPNPKLRRDRGSWERQGERAVDVVDACAAGRRALGRAHRVPARRAATRPVPAHRGPVKPIARVGICCSGGGIRSAAFNLGALQALQEERVLGSAEYVAAVSGGNYIASALTISHAYAEPGAEDGHPLWAHGSPEERLLRRNTNYLAPGFTGRV